MELARSLAQRTDDPREFIALLGRDAAGIAPGFSGLLTLVRGGRNVIPGRGFRHRFDDDTDGQVRHFAGVAAASVRLGPRLARRLAIDVLQDPPASPDGRLTDAALAFAADLTEGRLLVADAPDWIARTLCRASETQESAQRSPR